MNVTLPWFPTQISPNSRKHWAVIAKYKRIYRTECWYQTRESVGFVNLAGDFKIHLKIQFFPPSRRHYDLDNCVASIKSGLDGVADALKVNDRRFTLDPQMMDDIGGYIKIEIGV